MLRLVLPKGSLEQATLELFEAADIPVRRGSDRDYHGRIDDPRVEKVSILRPQEIPRYLEEGFFDLGITGRDWIEETGARVERVATLSYSKRQTGPVRIVLAVARENPANRPEDLPQGVRVSTEYPNLTRRYFESLGIDARIFLSYGATEAKVPEIVDAIVDVTETGGTLVRHGMKIIGTILESYTELVACPASYRDQAKRKAMEELAILLQGAVAARGRVLLKLNVAEEKLPGVLAVLPAMKAPTVSPLATKGYMAVETVVEKAGINTLIPVLKERGAEDILEIPLSKIVP